MAKEIEFESSGVAQFNPVIIFAGQVEKNIENNKEEKSEQTATTQHPMT